MEWNGGGFNMKASLGYKPNWGELTAPTAKGEKPEYFPTVNIEGKAAEKLLEHVEVGEKITVTLECVVTGTTKRDTANRKECNVTLEAKSIDCPTNGKAYKDKSGGEAMDDYRKKSRS
jgi:hypothetical protein